MESVEFETIDGAIIPHNELLRHRNNIPFVMNLRRKGTFMPLRYSINLNQSFSISNKNEKKIGEEKYLEYCLGIGLPQRNSYFLANFASKLHHTLPVHKPFTSGDILQGLNTTMSYYRATQSAIYD